MRSFLQPRLFFSFLLFFFLAGTALSSRAADDVVWSGLIYATNEKNPAPAPKEIAAYSQKLQHIFGYNQLQLLSSPHEEIMDNQFEHWLLPGAGFCLLVNTEKSGANHILTLQLYQEKKLIVRTVAQLARQSPIFLKGPLYGEGQLIIVLLVK